MATRALLFDLDGTIWRGHDWYAFVLKQVSGLEEALTMERLAAGDNIVHLAKEIGLSRGRLIRACCDRVNALEVYEGVFDVLRRLSAAERKLAVVTSLSEQIAGPALRSLGLHRFFGATKFAARKPGPQLVRAALADLGETANKRHYYVGDTATDAVCAANAGVAFAWASYGYGSVASAGEMKSLQRFSDVELL